LLEKAIRETDQRTRIGLVQRISASPHAPVDLLNEFFFEAPAVAKDAIIARNAGGQDAEDEDDGAIDQTGLIEAFRNDRSNLAQSLAEAVGLSPATVHAALGDQSARALAVLCKGARLSRATFSAIALLSDRNRSADDSYLRLASFDVVPASAAKTMLAFWRTRPSAHQVSFSRAAE
jgi:hypothetical protein